MTGSHLSQPFVVVAIALGMALALIAQANAGDNFDSLYAAIEAANSKDGNSIIGLTEDIRLGAALPPITGDIRIEGNGYSISGADSFRIFDIVGGRLSLVNLTLTDARAQDQGGAIRLRNGAEIMIDAVRFRDNGAGSGGAIASMTYNNRLTISGSSFVGNTASAAGGAIVTYGGISNISASTFSDNSAVQVGGAIAVEEGRLRISNSTLHGNSADAGGAIHTDAGETTLTHLTVMANEANPTKAAGIHRERGIINLRNSIVAGGAGGSDCSGYLSENRGNFSQDGTCATKPGGDPMLADLTGSPAYYPLLDGSPAVDAADREFCLDVDQVGAARPYGDHCDIGAFESTTASPAPETLETLKCSLADRIRSANRNVSIGGCPRGTSHDIITITEDITLDEALPVIVGTITIEGKGHTLSGAGEHRLFDVSGGRLTLKDVTLAEGHTDAEGGAIRLRNGGKLVAENTIFKNNWAYRGGVIAAQNADVSVTVNNSSFTDNVADQQAGVFLLNGGITSISKSSFVNNKAEFAWGGVFYTRNSRLAVSNSTFSGNEGLAGGVLAIMSGEASFAHITMVNNESYYLGGDALYRYGGTIVLRNSIVSNRGEIEDCSRGLTAQRGNLNPDGTCSDIPSGDVGVGGLTGSPAYFPLKDGSPALDAADADFCLPTDQVGRARPAEECDIGAIESTTAELPVAPIEPPPPCPLFNQIVAANTDAPSGGCPAGKGQDVITLKEDITLDRLLPRITSDITIEGNGYTISGDNRFRIFNVTEGRLTLNNARLTKGKVPPNAKGGAVLVENVGQLVVNDSIFSESMAKEGGAIFITNPGSRLIINNSSFIDNRAIAFGAGGAIVMEDGKAVINNSSFVKNRSDNVGGAIGTWGSGEISVTNSTFSGNTAKSGGAVYSGGASLSFAHVTLADNYADDGGAIAIFENYPSRVRVRNSIIFDQRDRVRLCAGKTLAESRGNLIGDSTCDGRASGDPLLGELTGSPGYYPLEAGSPAIDAADQAYCAGTDQLGRSRPLGARCDIGAIEFGAN